jgi:hypothetical protein
MHISWYMQVMVQTCHGTCVSIGIASTLGSSYSCITEHVWTYIRLCYCEDIGILMIALHEPWGCLELLSGMS